MTNKKSDDGSRPAAQGGVELPRLDFSTFVLSLSTSALYQMGLVAGPDGSKDPVPDRELARQTIDTLEMLQEKTRGNLDPQESKLFENLLYELRMRFVEVAK
jgi:hypothetical protein